jgi:hypothetical protein
MAKLQEMALALSYLKKLFQGDLRPVAVMAVQKLIESCEYQRIPVMESWKRSEGYTNFRGRSQIQVQDGEN